MSEKIAFPSAGITPVPLPSPKPAPHVSPPVSTEEERRKDIIVGAIVLLACSFMFAVFLWTAYMVFVAWSPKPGPGPGPAPSPDVHSDLARESIHYVTTLPKAYLEEESKVRSGEVKKVQDIANDIKSHAKPFTDSLTESFAKLQDKKGEITDSTRAADLLKEAGEAMKGHVR